MPTVESERRVGAARGWGTTPADRAASFACDRHLDEATSEWHRAVDVDAPVATTFRWLCQLRVAPYSYDLLDNFGRRSPRKLTPGLDELEVGQKAMMFYEIVEFERDRHITAAFRRFPWMFGRRVVTYAVEPRDGGSRIVAKVRHVPPKGPYGRFVIGPGLPRIDLIMMRKQLRTLKKLAERDARAAVPETRERQAA
jgi:hypothetical protein